MKTLKKSVIVKATWLESLTALLKMKCSHARVRFIYSYLLNNMGKMITADHNCIHKHKERNSKASKYSEECRCNS